MDGNIEFTLKKEALIKALSKTNDIRDILNISFNTTGHPVALYDLAYKLLTFTDNIETDDRLWNELTKTGTFSHESVHFFNTENFIGKYASSEAVILLKSDKLKYDRISGALFDKKGSQMGDIIVVACKKPFEEGDLELIEIVCKYLEEALQKSDLYSKMPQVAQKSVISDLISGNKDAARCEQELKKIYADLKKNIFIGVVDTIQYERTLTHLIYFKELFKRLQSEFKYYVYLNNIVIILSIDEPIFSEERDMPQLVAFFKKYGIYAGISGKLQNLYEVKKYFKQALNAMNYGMNIDSSRNVFKYDDFRLELFVNSMQDINIPALCHPLVFLIHEYDSKNKTSYAEDLYNFFIYGYNFKIAAEMLGLDVADFTARINEAGEIFNLDFSNGNMLHGIFRTMKLWKSYPEKFKDITE